MHPLILVADDDPICCALVELRLKMAGYQVVTAADGELALERLRALDPALIILDVEMPKLGGLGVLKALSTDRRLAGTPVMMLTSRAERAVVAQASEFGVMSYMLKPFDPDYLEKRVTAMLTTADKRRAG